jgi:two-component system response regulator MtrA
MSVRIVVADDEADILRLVAFTLRRRGYTVLEAVDGAQALQLILAELPDLAILDVMMPMLSGLDVVREMAANTATANIPVLIVSAKGQAADIEAGLATGAASYLPKPFSPRVLADRVASILEH